MFQPIPKGIRIRARDTKAPIRKHSDVTIWFSAQRNEDGFPMQIERVGYLKDPQDLFWLDRSHCNTDCESLRGVA